jgi:hypothetical protein
MSEGWEDFKKELQDKSARCCLKSILMVNDDNGIARDVLTEFSLLNENNVSSFKHEIWTDNGTTNTERFKEQDRRIKADLLATFLLESLTFSARKTIDQSKSDWTVDYDGDIFCHGPTILWLIATEVKPDNGHLVDLIKTKLRTLTVKDYGFSIKLMLTEFASLTEEIGQLGGSYLENEQQLDFWRAIKTMEEKEFHRYVCDKHDDYRELDPTSRPTVKALIKQFKRKQTNMESDQKWNKLSVQDAQILALTTYLTSKGYDSDASRNRRKRNATTPSDPEKSPKRPTKSPNDTTTKKRDFSYPEWRLEAPKEGESTTKEVDGKHYHWCSKDHGQYKGGLWGTHTEEEHKGGFSVFNKNVSFADAVKDNSYNKNKSKFNEDSAQTYSSAKLQLDRKALLAQTSALKKSSFMAQFIDQGNK